jgi:Sulfotransferase domain
MRLWRSFVSAHRFDAAKSIEDMEIAHRSESVNLYHCCVHKTGSQWIRSILSDPIVYKYSGLKGYHYQSGLAAGNDSRDISHRTFTEPFPRVTIVTPLYLFFGNFTTLPKPENYKAFFVMRDPRDILISWYFSMRYSHIILGNVPKLRATLDRMSFDDGILFAMDHLNRSGHFQLLASWIDAPRTDPNVLLVRFEDLIGSASEEVFGKLFEHCDILMPRKQLCVLLAKYSFRALSGRRPGQEDTKHHYRKGISGDWRNHLSDSLATRFKKLAGNLVSRLGYAE